MCSIQRAWLYRTRLSLIFSLTFFLAIGVSPTMAAEISDLPLDIDALIAAILIRNSGLESQRLRVAALEELASSAGALDDPQVSYAIAPASFGDSIPSNLGNALGVRQNIQLSQSIPWPGKRALRSEKMAARAEATQHSYLGSRLELVAEARSLWAQWWYVNSAILTNQEHQRLSSDLRSVAETRYATGTGLQQEVLQIQTHAVQLQHQHIVLEQEQRRVQSHINYLLSQSSSVTLNRPLGQLAMPELPERARLEQWLLETHPALSELKAQSNVALLNRRLTEKDDYPDLQINVGYNELWNESDLRLQVGVSLSIPLDFGKRSTRKAAAQFEYHSALMVIQDKRSELLSELEAQLSNFDQAAHGIHLIETELLPSSEQTLSAVQANYEGGGGNFYALIDAQEQLLDMQLLLSNSYAEQFIALAELNKLTGGQLWPLGATK